MITKKVRLIMHTELPSLRRIILLPLRWALLLALVLTLIRPTPAYAANLVVNTLDKEQNSDGDCSLAEAIAAANTNNAVDACAAGSPLSVDIITFAVSGTIGVSEQLEVTAGGPMLINGGGAITLSGGDYSYLPKPVMAVATGGDVTLKDLTITGGQDGGITNAGRLELIHATVTGNSALGNGGGISSSGTLIVSGSTISDNRTEHDGGGISSSGTTNIVYTDLLRNFSNLDGAGIDNNGTLDIGHSTLSGNHSQRFGGGISNYGTLTMTNATVTGSDAYRFGGGLNNGGTMTMTDSDVSNNVGEFGVGGVFNRGTLTISHSTLQGNSAYGECGGMFNTGTLNVTNNTRLDGTGICNVGRAAVENSTLAGSNLFNVEFTEILGIMTASGDGIMTLTNSTVSGITGAHGGGILNLGTLTVTSSTVSGNSAFYEGGGIYNGQELEFSSGHGILTINNSTLSANFAGQSGGAIYNDHGTVAIHNSTLSDNGRAQFATGAIFNQAGSVTLDGSIVAASNYGGNCAGVITDGGYNIDDADTCGFSAANNSLTNTDPRLAALGDYGGPTQTLALLSGSPAIDTGDPLHCPATDQRGVSRPQDGNLDGVARCDVGAYEAGIVATVDITPTTLSLQSKGTWMNAYIELPSGYNVGAIDLSSVRLQGSIPAANQVAKVADHDKDGIPDILVQFSQQALIAQLTYVRGEVTLLLTGRLRDGTPFQGTDTIFVGPK
jgi:hypothetical protein